MFQWNSIREDVHTFVVYSRWNFSLREIVAPMRTTLPWAEKGFWEKKFSLRSDNNFCARSSSENGKRSPDEWKDVRARSLKAVFKSLWSKLQEIWLFTFIQRSFQRLLRNNIVILFQRTDDTVFRIAVADREVSHRCRLNRWNLNGGSSN